MYPNSALSAGQLALIAVVAVLCLAIWLISVFVAARQPRRDRAAGQAALPQHRAAAEEPERKAA
jgi:predicted permease